MKGRGGAVLKQRDRSMTRTAPDGPLRTAQTCQQGGDVKGFKGRGAHRAVSEAWHEVDSIHAAMAQLVQEAKDLARDVAERVLDLAVHRRSGTQQQSLRWRVPGSGGKHIGLDQVEPLLALCSQHVRQRYIWLTERARGLNEQEKRARSQLRRARSGRDTAQR